MADPFDKMLMNGPYLHWAASIAWGHTAKPEFSLAYPSSPGFARIGVAPLRRHHALIGPQQAPMSGRRYATRAARIIAKETSR